MPLVSPLGRLLDAIGIVLILAGAGCYGWAYVSLERLHEHPPTAPHLLWVGLAAYNRYTRLSTIGLVVAVLGLAVAIIATLVTQRSRRIASPGSPETA